MGKWGEWAMEDEKQPPAEQTGRVAKDEGGGDEAKEE
jgi:hypothetical protein